MYSGFDQNISHQQIRGHKHADIYVILIIFSSSGVNSNVRCVAFEMCGPRRRIIFGKRREVAIKDESDKALQNTDLWMVYAPWSTITILQ